MVLNSCIGCCSSLAATNQFVSRETSPLPRQKSRCHVIASFWSGWQQVAGLSACWLRSCWYTCLLLWPQTPALMLMLAVSWFVPLGGPGTVCSGKALTLGILCLPGFQRHRTCWPSRSIIEFKQSFRHFLRQKVNLDWESFFLSLVAWGVLLCLLSA